MLGFARWLGMLVMTVTLLCGARASAQDTPRAPLHGSCAELPASERQGVARRQSMDDMEVSELLVRLQRPTFVSPPRTSGPTTVGIALEVLEISELDAGTNTFTMEGYLDLVWCDPREAFDPDKVGADREIFLERDAEKELDYIWWPDFYFANEVGPRRVENEELILSPDGTVEYRERFGVTLATDFAMRQFPFDTQQLEIHLQSFAWKTDDLVFVVQDNVLELSPEFEILEWDVVGFDEHTSGVGDGEYSELIAELTVSRDPGFYITKIMIPLAIIVALSWAVFWMIGETLAERMSVSFTGVLTSVAYQFIVSESLPRHIYDTFLDGFVLLSFVVMVLTIVENVLVNSLVLSNRPTMATRVDQLSRLLFPLGYLAGMVGLALFYLLPM